MTKDVTIVEVGPRDGLQNEATPIPVKDKIALVDLLSDAGFSRIEVASFVSPKWVPQMAGSGAVLAGITRKPGIRYTALTPNMRGLEDAIAARADEVAVFASASEGFSRANINATIAESLDRFAPVCARAREVGIPVRGYISCVTDCPYDGPTPPETVARVTRALFDLDCFEVSLGDTIGQGTPDAVARMLDAVLDVADPDRLAGHFHDTAGRALENVDVALNRGLRVFDTSIAGLGGCPYAPGAAGNLSTEALAMHLTAQGYIHGLNPDALAKAARFARTLRKDAA